jgi:hypothetical protein
VTGVQTCALPICSGAEGATRAGGGASTPGTEAGSAFAAAGRWRLPGLD